MEPRRSSLAGGASHPGAAIERQVPSSFLSGGSLDRPRVRVRCWRCLWSREPAGPRSRMSSDRGVVPHVLDRFLPVRSAPTATHRPPAAGPMPGRVGPSIVPGPLTVLGLVHPADRGSRRASSPPNSWCVPGTRRHVRIRTFRRRDRPVRPRGWRSGGRGQLAGYDQRDDLPRLPPGTLRRRRLTGLPGALVDVTRGRPDA